jgi:hypothetical protein
LIINDSFVGCPSGARWISPKSIFLAKWQKTKGGGECGRKDHEFFLANPAGERLAPMV